MLQLETLPYRGTDRWIEVTPDGSPTTVDIGSKVLWEVPIRCRERTHVYASARMEDDFYRSSAFYRRAPIADITSRGKITLSEDQAKLLREYMNVHGFNCWFEVLESKVNWEDDPFR
jgi:hypothetical protein